MHPSSDSIQSDLRADAAAPKAGAAYGSILDAVGGKQIGSIWCCADYPMVAVALYQAPPYDLHVPALQVSRLSINLTASRVTGGVESERSRSFDAARHSMFLAPALASMHWRKPSPSRHLIIYFHPRWHAEDCGLAAGQLEDAGPIFNLDLAGSGGLVDQLAAELTAPSPFAAEAVDSLARLLLVMLARRRGGASSAHAMSAPLLRRLECYVDANLRQRILVADLATVAGLPPEVFARAYVRYTGRSPHQFVLALRVERAAQSLRGSQLGLAEVAASCGFANQQHMTHVLTDRLGMSPAALRRVALPKTVGA